MSVSVCPECHKSIPPAAPAGQCPECLLKRGLERAGFASAAFALTTPQGGRQIPLTPEFIAPCFPQMEILELLGQGGMGTVFKARQTKLDRMVAVKIIRPETASDPAFAERFMREAKTLARLNHPNIVSVHDFGEVNLAEISAGLSVSGGTLFFFIMEYVDGANLRQLMQSGKMSPELTLRIIQQVCDALQFAHEEGIVHRDIKPENLFLLRRKETDFVKVVDFGISKSLRTTGEDEEQVRLTQTGMVLGTPLYMSPEQARGDDELDHRVDLYALGIIMYEAATGRVPFSGNNYLSVISQVLNEDPKPMRELRPELSDEFEAIVSKAMAKDRVDRYADAAAMLADVSALIEDPTHSTERARISGPRRRLAKSKSSGKVALWIGAIALTVLALVVTVRFLMGSSSSQNVVASPNADAGVAAVAVDAAPKLEPDAYVDTNRYVFLAVDSSPTGASLECDGFPKGTAPTTIKFVEERKEVECWAMLDGYDSKRFVVNPLELPKEQVIIKVKKLEAGKKPTKVPTKGSEQGSGKLPEQPGSRTGGETGGFAPPVTK